MSLIDSSLLSCSKRSDSGTAHQAFTLLEVLIVIAMVTMLIAALFSSVNGVRTQSKRVMCQSNLRQIAIAWSMYLDAHNGYFLKGVNTNINYGGQQGRGSAAFGSFPKKYPDDEEPCTASHESERCTDPISKPLNLYLGLPEVAFDGANVFRCPADHGDPEWQPTFFDYAGTSYQTNLMLVGQTWLQYPPRDPCASVRAKLNLGLHDTNIAKVGKVSKLVLMGDYGWVAEWTPWHHFRIEWHDQPFSHNVAFLDGHVEFLRIRKGLHVTPEYTVIPFKDLIDDAQACQKEVEGE